MIYSIQYSDASITEALLKRGANPNAIILQEGSRGNTALHFACLFQKDKHVEALLKYDANPFALNEHGQKPLDLLPKDVIKSTRVNFKSLFEVNNYKTRMNYSCIYICLFIRLLY